MMFPRLQSMSLRQEQSTLVATHISVGRVLSKSLFGSSFRGNGGGSLQPRPSSVHPLFGSRSLSARRTVETLLLAFQPHRLYRSSSSSSASSSSLSDGGRLAGGEETTVAVSLRKCPGVVEVIVSARKMSRWHLRAKEDRENEESSTPSICRWRSSSSPSPPPPPRHLRAPLSPLGRVSVASRWRRRPRKEARRHHPGLCKMVNGIQPMNRSRSAFDTTSKIEHACRTGYTPVSTLHRCLSPA